MRRRPNLCHFLQCIDSRRYHSDCSGTFSCYITSINVLNPRIAGHIAFDSYMTSVISSIVTLNKILTVSE